MAILLNNWIYKAKTEGRIRQNVGIYLAKLWDIFAKTMG